MGRAVSAPRGNAAAASTLEHRAALRRIADELRTKKQGQRGRCLRSAEWFALPHAHRMAVMLLAGIDGELATLARRSWPEFSDPEKVAVQVAIRSLRESLAGCHSLTVRTI